MAAQGHQTQSSFGRMRSVLILVAFSSILSFPAFAFLGGSRPGTVAERGYVGRPPILVGSFFDAAYWSQWDNYFESRFVLRAQAIRLDAEIDRFLDDEGGGPVVIGDGGWLYYVADFESACNSAATPTEVAGRLGAIRSQLEAVGTRVVLMMAPDKSEVVRQPLNADDLARRSCSGSRIGELRDRLSAEFGADQIDVLSPMLAYSQPTDLYHRTDTHWTYVGARIGLDALLSRLAPTWWLQQTLRSDGGTEFLTDLSNMLGRPESEVIRGLSLDDPPELEIVETVRLGGHYRQIGGDPPYGSVVVYFDSFFDRSGILDVLAVLGRDTRFVHWEARGDWGDEVALLKQADLVIFEAVSRDALVRFGSIPRLGDSQD